MFNIFWVLQSDSIGIDTISLQSLSMISEQANLPGKMSLNRLITGGIYSYHEKVYLPDILKSDPIFQEQSSVNITKHLIKVFPNPASEFFIIEYDLSKQGGNPYINIVDITGKPIMEVQLANHHSQKVISSKGFANGVYLIQLINMNEVLDISKIIIAR
jgi:hypothetical protein